MKCPPVNRQMAGGLFDLKRGFLRRNKYDMMYMLGIKPINQLQDGDFYESDGGYVNQIE